jgi:hypothetical protein
MKFISTASEKLVMSRLFFRRLHGTTTNTLHCWGVDSSSSKANSESNLMLDALDIKYDDGCLFGSYDGMVKMFHGLPCNDDALLLNVVLSTLQHTNGCINSKK